MRSYDGYMDELNLKPRAIAVLLTLRNGPKSDVSIRNGIGDLRTNATRDLLSDCRNAGIVKQVPGSIDWELDTAGVNWLGNEGLRIHYGVK